MEHADFTIDREFWTDIGGWRYTDVGTRTLCGLKKSSRKALSRCGP
jgi:hypothetical protein